MATFYTAPDANYFSTTLSGAISDSATTITLSSITNLNYPGVLVIDREDGSGNATPNAREVICYTGISGNDLTGVTRGFSSSTARSHSDGALVEAVVDVTLWNDLRDAVAAGMQTDGTGIHVANATITSYTNLVRVHVASIASIARAEISEVKAPAALASNVTIAGSLDVSNASVTGLGLNPTFVFTGNLSGPTTLIQTPLVMPRAGMLQWVNVLTRTVASTASVVVDINKNGTSIFDAACRPSFAAGNTLVSTASIKTKNFGQGDRVSWDCDMVANEDAHVTDLTIIMKAA